MSTLKLVIDTGLNAIPGGRAISGAMGRATSLPTAELNTPTNYSQILLSVLPSS
jgi:hypothetical protein